MSDILGSDNKDISYYDRGYGPRLLARLIAARQDNSKRLLGKEAENKPAVKAMLNFARFIPAKQYKPGPAVQDWVGRLKYFVVHRPNFRGKGPTTMIGTVGTLLETKQKVSTHFVISLTGDVVQMVDLNDQAYHVTSSGVSNRNSVGVELEGWVDYPTPEAQYRALARVLAALRDLCGWTLVRGTGGRSGSPAGVLFGHQELQSNRHDPGKGFDYDYVLSLAAAHILPAGTNAAATYVVSKSAVELVLDDAVAELTNMNSAARSPGQRVGVDAVRALVDATNRSRSDQKLTRPALFARSAAFSATYAARGARMSASLSSATPPDLPKTVTVYQPCYNSNTGEWEA